MTTSRSFARDATELGIWVVGVFAMAAAGSMATQSGLGEWYDSLAKPFFQPPPWIFGPVWSVLYLLMAVAAWMIWRERDVTGNRKTFRLFFAAFGLQLVLNTGWSILFFGLRAPVAAFVEICILWLAIGITILAAERLNKKAAWLLIPYLCWTSFAMILNLAIARMNS